MACAAGLALGLGAAIPVVPALLAALAPEADSPSLSNPSTQRFLALVLTACLVALGTLLSLALASARRWSVSISTFLIAGAVAHGVGLALGFALAFALVAVGAAGLACARPLPRAAVTRGSTGSGVLFAVECLSLVWGAWLFSAPRDLRWPIQGTMMACTLWALWRTQRPEPSPLRQDVVIAAPLLLLPGWGLFRSTSLWFPVLLLLCMAALAVWTHRRPGALGGRVQTALVSVVGPLALVTMLVVPLGMRDLPTANWKAHEGFHFAWVNSILDGKWMLADANLIYGPLREYLMAGYALLTSVTLEQLRVAEVLTNLLGTAILLVTGHALTRGRPALQLWLAYLLVVHTPLRCLLGYRDLLSLGWADQTRIALPMLGMVGAVGAFGRLPSPRAQFWWGSVTGLSLWYSQEYGLAAAAAVVLTLLATLLTRRGPASFRQRSRLAAIHVVMHLGGAGAVSAAMFALYATAGKARQLAEMFTLFLTLKSQGQAEWASIGSVLSLPLLENPWTMITRFSENGYRFSAGAPIEYAALLVIYMVAICVLVGWWFRREQSTDAPVLFALTAFGLAVFRVPLGRADLWHLVAVSPPALLILVMLVRRLDVRRAPFSLAGVTAAATVLCSVALGELAVGVHWKMDAWARGVEAPPSLEPHASGLARAGDVFIPPDEIKLVEFIQSQTTPTDAIYCLIDDMNGAEVYFLADRRNPTRFDTNQEAWTPQLRDEIIPTLQRDPPKLVLGDYRWTGDLGPDGPAFLEEHTVLKQRMGPYSVYTYLHDPVPQYPRDASTNLARAATVRVSSLHKEYGRLEAIHDGIRYGWGAHTTDEDHPWVELDLGSVVRVGEVLIRNRTDNLRDRAVPLRVEVSVDGKQYRTVGDQAEVFDYWSIPLDHVEARYIRATAQRWTTLHLAEIEIYP